MSVWEQRANQLRKRRQMASREELFGSPTEDNMDTPTGGGHHLPHAPSLSPETSPGHLPESPMSVGMEMPEPPMSIPEPPESEPLPLLSCVTEERTGSGGGGGGATSHRSNTERRHRVARKFRAAAMVAGMEGTAGEGGRHRKHHRHREGRHRDSPTQAEGGADRKTPEACGAEEGRQPEEGASSQAGARDGDGHR